MVSSPWGDAGVKEDEAAWKDGCAGGVALQY